MSHELLDLASVQSHVPEFILKLYSILEKNQYSHIICWGPSSSQVIIKDSRKLEKSVLPNFFRHNKLESFVRQLNMYGFRKLNKFSKQRSRELYFQNEHFRHGDIESLVLIQRKRRGPQEEKCDSDTPDDKNFELDKYRRFVRSNVGMIRDEIGRLAKEYPDSQSSLSLILRVSNILIGEEGPSSEEADECSVACQEAYHEMLFLKTVRQFKEFATIKNLKSICSIDEEFKVCEC